MSYHYVTTIENETTKSITDQALQLANIDLNTVMADLDTQIIQEYPSKFVEEALVNGYNFTVNTVNSVSHSISFQPFLQRLQYKIHTTITVDFNSDQPLMASPIAPVFIAVLYKVIDAIIIIVVAYFIIQALKDVITSMTTTTTTTTEYDPITGLPTKKETTTKPQTDTITILVIGAIAFMMLMFIMNQRSGQPISVNLGKK